LYDGVEPSQGVFRRQRRNGKTLLRKAGAELA
jgi:hypothetical protein